MQSLTDNLQVSLEDFVYTKGKSSKTVPLLRVIIKGAPSIAQISSLMNNIRQVTDQINEKYVALTDLSMLEVNAFFSKVILLGMEKAYKSYLTVKNQSALSFVILGEKHTNKRLLAESIERINKMNVISKDYSYNYYFLTDESQVKEIVEKTL